MTGKVLVSARDYNMPLAHVIAGARYRLVTDGKWNDLVHRPDARGYTSPWYMRRAEHCRRHPNANWFALIGFVVPMELQNRDAVPPSDTLLYDLSAHLNGQPAWTCPATGVLHVFANDVPGFYWNNWGHIHVLLLPEA